MEPTLTAFVSRDKDEQKTYKSGDKVYYKQGIYITAGELHYDDNGWSIYEIKSPPKQMVVLDDNTLQSKEITMTPYDPPTNTYNTPADNGWGGHGGKRSRRRKTKKSRRSRKYR